MKVIKNVRIYTGHRVIDDGYIRFDKKIIDIDEMRNYSEFENETPILIDASYIIPGFIDIHSHGGYGYDSMDATPDEINDMVQRMAKNEGITTYFCTTMTESASNVESALKNINVAMKENKLIQGIHLEGPFISEQFKGAQAGRNILIPDEKLLERWVEISGGNIRMITYAPENADSKFEEYCTDNNIILSVGHSNATFDQCVSSNASHITHLYNAQRPLSHREPGVTGYGLIKKDVYTEIIFDGVHIVPEMVDLAIKLKGVNHVHLITDSMRAKGMPEGKSELGGQEVFVTGNEARLSDGTLAGSILSFNQAYENVINKLSISIEDTIQMTSVNQAHQFGLHNKGTLEIGKDADLLLMDRENKLIQTISYGKAL